MTPQKSWPPGFQDMLEFGLIEALMGRRARCFFMGAEIPDGPLAYTSRHNPEPLSEFEKLLVVTACGGNTGWHHMIYRAKLYAPHLSNYSGAAGGRSFPSAAGFHTSNTFFTDDEGVYLLDNRDSSACADRAPDGSLDFETAIEAVKMRVKRVRDGRLGVPAEVPYVEAHNTWVVNHPGTLLVIPVADLSQHVLLALCYFLQNGAVIRDDRHDCPIPGMETFRNLVDIENTWPLTFVEQWSLTEVTAELSTSCYAGALMLQAMGLGGWKFNGIDPFSVLGASGNPAVPGLGFRFDTNQDWPYPIQRDSKVSWKGIVLHIFPTCAKQWKRCARANSARAVPSIRTRPALGRSPRKSDRPRRSTAKSSKNVWRCRLNTFSIASANSQARCPR